MPTFKRNYTPKLNERFDLIRKLHDLINNRLSFRYLGLRHILRGMKLFR